MAAKKIWLTWFPDEESGLHPQEVLGVLGRYGFAADGARWVDDLEKIGWAELGGILLSPDKADLWLVAGRRADLESNRNRCALSMLATMVRESRETPLSAMCLGLDFEPTADDLPMMLRDFPCLAQSNPSWSAKLVAQAQKPQGLATWDFRLNVIAHSLIGQWFELGPRQGQWQGAIFGTTGEGTITHHAVGPAGQLPEKTVLEYPTQGIQAQLGETEYTAWSVQNAIGEDQSYYVKVDGHPVGILVGENPEREDAEVATFSLV